MPENKAFKRLARKAAAEQAQRYTRVAEALRSQPAYVADYGFRQALAGFRSVEPVSSRRMQSELVVTRVLGSADRTEVDAELHTVDKFQPTPEMKGPSVSATLEVRGSTQSSTGMSLSLGGRRAELRITFPAIPPRSRRLRFLLAGDLGDWELTVPVKPIGGVARQLQRITVAKATRQGVTLEATEAVFDRDRTVVRILASAVPPMRFIRGIGTEWGSRRLPGSELSLVDDLGNKYVELADVRDRSDPAGRDHAVVFPAVHASATRFRLSIPFVAVEESGDPADFDLPIASRQLQIGRYRVEIKSVEASAGSMAAFYPLRIRYRGVDKWKTRRLLGPGQIFVNDRGVGFCSPSVGGGDCVDVQVPDPPAARIRFAYPRIHVTGPWNLVFRRG